VSLEPKLKYGLINVAAVVASVATVATPILADERDEMTLEEVKIEIINLDVYRFIYFIFCAV
jgi:hypothetical protein